MANCPNCNAPLEDDARFCANCGAAVPPPAPESAPQTPVPQAPEAVPDTIFCPNCGGQTSAAFEYCEHCGAALNAPSAPDVKKSGGPGMKKWLVLGGGAIVVVAALVIVLISVFSGGGGGKGYGLYIKDGEVYYSNLSKNGAWQLTSKFSEGSSNSSLAYVGSQVTRLTAMSKDGKTLFFPDKFDSGGFTLYYRSVSGKKEAVKIDSDINRYAVNDSASLVTYLKNGTLYQYNMSRGEKEKLDGDVENFYVSDDGKKIIYLDDEDTLYQIDSGKEEEKLDSDVTAIPAISDDCKTMIYRKDDTLYLKRDGKEKEKIASDVADVICAYKTGEVYYVEEDDGDYTLCYFDGRNSTDVTDEYSKRTDYSSETPLLVYRDIDDAYWLAAGGKTTELDAEEPGGFAFSSDGKSVWYVDEPDKNSEGDLYRITVSNGTAKKAEKVDDDVYAYSLAYLAGHLIYFKDVSDYEGELYVDGKKVDDDVYLSGGQMSESGALLYATDFNSSREEGTLKQYSGGKSVKIEDDVYAAAYMPNGSILYLTDYSTSKYRGDLYVYNGKSTKLDEDVVTIIPVYNNKYKGYW